MNYESVEQARDYLLDKIGTAPDLAVVMGSGISAVDEILRDTVRIHYATIPHFVIPRVAGHRGEAAFGKVGKVNVIVFEGRTHLYEGNTMNEVTFCARVIGRTGARALLLSNAAGAINPDFKPGQLMLISDHLNFMGVNPLAGPNDDRWGPRFLDQSATYDPGLREKLRQAAKGCDVSLVEGVYAAISGPTYETPAETRFLRNAGADAAGMSTVPEAIVARHMGLKVAGISMIANAAASSQGRPVDHDQVLTMTAQMSADLGMLLLRFLELYAE
jgi:purine-nucleoside phosphorylase